MITETVPPPTAVPGFAPAAGPVAPTAIITDSDGLHTADVHIPTPQGELPVYIAWPDSKGPHPVILVIHERFGVHEHIRDVARRLAKQGYFALAPALFFGGGDLSKVASSPNAGREVVSKIADAEVLADLDRVVRWARNNNDDVTRIGITGFCWGGRIVWLYAAYNPYVKAGVAWYGRLEGEATPNTPRFPIDVAPELTVPVLGLYGAADQGIPPESVERTRAALARGTSGSEIVLYDDAPHAFHADYRQSYREAAAKDGWQKLLAWFRAHGL